jgi:UrcA family protein
MKYATLALALVAMAGLSSTTVFAGPRETEHTTVSVKGVDMNNPVEITTLYRRLDRAAKQVCDSEMGNQHDIAAQDRACAARSLDDAVDSIGDKRLTDIHMTRTGRKAEAVTVATVSGSYVRR